MSDKSEWFTKRWEALGDVTELLKAASPDYRDPDVYFNDLVLNEEDENIAEKRLIMLESLVLKNNIDLKAIKVEKVRIERNRKLQESDWTMLSDSPLSGECRTEYRKYRQYLRDLPQLVNCDGLHTGVVDIDDYKEWYKTVKYNG